MAQVAGLIGDHLPRSAAVILQPEGVAHRDKDLVALEAEFAEHLDIVTAEKVIDDFFVLTPRKRLPGSWAGCGGCSSWCGPGAVDR